MMVIIVDGSEKLANRIKKEILKKLLLGKQVKVIFEKHINIDQLFSYQDEEILFLNKEEIHKVRGK